MLQACAYIRRLILQINREDHQQSSGQMDHPPQQYRKDALIEAANTTVSN